MTKGPARCKDRVINLQALRKAGRLPSTGISQREAAKDSQPLAKAAIFR
ncbi:MAG: hypothetical protein OXC57_12275 [Rhodobacteraceae bacterium]|nr:hypothetical protein [Paracoccaceae bacterium]